MVVNRRPPWRHSIRGRPRGVNAGSDMIGFGAAAMASGEGKLKLQPAVDSPEMKMMVEAIREIPGELVRGLHRPWAVELGKRNRQYVEWTTGIGLILLTIVFPLLLASGQVSNMAVPILWLIWLGSVLVVISVGLGIAYSLLFHNEIMTEIYLELVSRIESLKAPLVARILDTISEPQTFEWKIPEPEFAEHLYEILADPSCFDDEIAKVEKRSKPMYALHVGFFTLGLALVVIPLFVYFTQALL